MRIYLDACCLNRPFDDQTQHRIRLKSEAIAILLKQVGDNIQEMVSSDVLELEIEKIPDRKRQKRIQELLNLAGQYVTIGNEEGARGRERIVAGPGEKPRPVAGRGKGMLTVIAEDDDHPKDIAE